MNPRPNAKIEFLCNGYAVCSIDDEHAVMVPLKNFEFSPVVGQKIYLGGCWDTPRLCTCDDLFDQHALSDRESDGSRLFAGYSVR